LGTRDFTLVHFEYDTKIELSSNLEVTRLIDLFNFIKIILKQEKKRKKKLCFWNKKKTQNFPKISKFAQISSNFLLWDDDEV